MYYHEIQDVLGRIVEKFRCASINGREIVCADGTSWVCHPIGCAWLADHAEKITILRLNMNCCSYCDVPANYLSEYGEEYSIQDQSGSRQIIRDEDLGKKIFEQEEKDKHIE